MIDETELSVVANAIGHAIETYGMENPPFSIVTQRTEHYKFAAQRAIEHLDEYRSRTEKPSQETHNSDSICDYCGDVV